MKKIVSIILAIAAIAFLAGCNNEVVHDPSPTYNFSAGEHGEIRLPGAGRPSVNVIVRIPEGMTTLEQSNFLHDIAEIIGAEFLSKYEEHIPATIHLHYFGDIDVAPKGELWKPSNSQYDRGSESVVFSTTFNPDSLTSDHRGFFNPQIYLTNLPLNLYIDE